MSKKVNKLTPYKDGKKRKMKMKKLTAVALTGRGANPHADVTFFKSHKGDDNEIVKGGDLKDILTSSVNGHQHGVSINNYGDGLSLYVGYAKGEGDDNGHDHVVAMDANGNFIVSENDGHTHEIDTAELRQLLFDRMTKSLDYFEEYGMSEEVEKRLNDSSIIKNIGDTLMTTEEKLAKAQEDLAKLRAQLATAVALGAMTDAHKKHYHTLGEASQEGFIAKSATEREADVEAALKADPVIFTAEDGTEFRKSDDPRVVQMAKSHDAMAKRLNTEVAKNDELEFEKRAETELGNVTGTVKARAALLKSVESIEDEEIRKEALEVLKSKNKANEAAFKESGVTKSPEAGNAEEQLNNLAKKYAQDNSVSFSKAYTEVLGTPEGAALYDQSVGA